MKSKIFIIIVFLVIFNGKLYGDWYESSFFWQLDPNSYLSRYIQMTNDTLGNNKKSFWGTNLCFDACFPDKILAPILADKIKALGFNLVRFHHMDAFSAPRGIFKDEDSTSNSILDQKMMDQLCFFISELKKREIYVDLNMLVSRVLKADKINHGVSRAGAKGSAFINLDFINSQKQYAKNLLSFFNPYTGCELGKDSHLAFVEILNENSLFWMWKKGYLQAGNSPYNLSDNDLTTLNLKWKKWLELKYKSVDHLNQAWKPKVSYTDFSISNALYSFSSGDMAVIDTSEFYSDIQKNYFSEMVRYIKNDIKVKCDIIGIGGFMEEEDLTTLESTDVIDFHGYWDHPRFKNNDWNKNDFKIANISTLPEHRSPFPERLFTFVSLGKPRTISEWGHCYPNEYNYETPIKISILSKVEKIKAVCHFCLINGLKNRDFFSQNAISDYFEVINNPQQQYLMWVSSLFFFNPNSFNIQRSKGVFIAHSENMTHYLSQNEKMLWNFGSANFSVNSKASLSLIDLNYTLKLKDFKKILLIIAVGRAKNTNSEWVNGSYQWGEMPVVMEDVIVNSINNPGQLLRLGSNGLPFVEGQKDALKTPCWIYSEEMGKGNSLLN